MADISRLALAYDFICSDRDLIADDGLVAMWHPMEDDDQETVVVYERAATDADASRASLHLHNGTEWPVEAVENSYWATEDITPTITADSGPAAEFCR